PGERGSLQAVPSAVSTEVRTERVTSPAPDQAEPLSTSTAVEASALPAPVTKAPRRAVTAPRVAALRESSPRTVPVDNTTREFVGTLALESKPSGARVLL